MPGKHIEDSATAGQNCRRCRANGAVLVVRTEPLCRECFVKYVHTKAIKRMETFRVRHAAPDQTRKLLLPISFGVSSVTLLHILDHHLQGQKVKTGRTGYGLVVLFVDTSSVEKAPMHEELALRLRERYPDHEHAALPLCEVLSKQDEDLDLPEGPSLVSTTDEGSPQERLTRLIQSLTSATARADVIATLRTRLIVMYANETGCEGILWGDSTTRLAERTLAETAKGRGFSLPWQITDGLTPHGVTFHYPLRDVLKKELISYAELSEPPLAPIIAPSRPVQASTSSKNTTIDALMKQYFESVEENFPSIVANVVRTTSKLEAPSLSEDQPCKLCNMPVPRGRFGIHGWGGDQQESLLEPQNESKDGLCYGCTRSAANSLAALL